MNVSGSKNKKLGLRQTPQISERISFLFSSRFLLVLTIGGGDRREGALVLEMQKPNVCKKNTKKYFKYIAAFWNGNYFFKGHGEFPL